MQEAENEVTTPGGRVGSRVAKLVADSIVHTRQRLASTQSDIAKEVFTSVTNEVSDEVRAVMGPVFRRIADDPGTPADLQPLFHHLASTRGQAYGWIGGAATGAAMSSGLGDLLTNSLAPVISSIIAENPNAFLSPEESAALAARGIAPGWDHFREAARRGVSGDRLNMLIRLTQRDLTEGSVLDLHNRGALSEDEAITEMVKGGMSRESARLTLTLAKTPLTPQDAAQAWARNLVSAEFVHLVCRSAGLTNEDGDVLMGLAGEPPATTDAILAWRRGILTEADVDRAIVQGPIRNEWIPAIKALFEEPLPPTEAASAVTQGHLTRDQGAAKAALSGFSGQDFDVMVDNSGIPPGLEFASEAYNRGLLTDADWEKMFLESRIKNKYIPLMRVMRENLPPAETARIAYRLGVADREWCVNILAGHGFSRPNAEIMLNLEDARAREGTKDLTRAQVVDLYEEGVIDEDQTVSMLSQLGYDQIEVGWMVTLAQGRTVKRFVNALTTRVRNAYVSGVMDAEEAATTLEQAGVGASQRDQLLAIWDLEAQALSAQLTPAQIVSAVKKDFLTRGEGKDRLVKRGYTDEDAEILIKLAVGS
jgi:hypothetical protein